MDITWVKLKTKMFDDEKIQLIESMPEADAVLVIWIKLLIQAGKINQNGFIFLAEDIPYTTEMLSTIFRRPLQIVKFALKTLVNFGMIEVTDSNVICISNWEKHQNVEGLDKVREQNRLRQEKHRSQKRFLLAENTGSVTLQSRDVTQQIKTKSKNKNKREEDQIPLVLNSWNSFAEMLGLTKIIKLSDKRIAGIKQRVKEKEFDLDMVFEKIRQSKFLQGDNDRSWKVDFDFVFCSKDNYLKILEGKYDDEINKTNIRGFTYAEAITQNNGKFSGWTKKEDGLWYKN